MNYKPDEATLISYLYGELDVNETEKVVLYLQHNPDAQRQLEQMKQTLDVMQRIKDKEVIAPPVFVGDSASGREFWRAGYFKIAMSIAATFLLIIVAGKLSGLEISYSTGELRIAFGPKQRIENVAQQPELNTGQVQQMIDASLDKNNKFMTARLEDTQQELKESINKSLTTNSQKIDVLVKQASTASQEQVRAFVADLQDNNLKLMQEYLTLSAKEQKQYVENLLVDFSAYLKEQRNQDLQLVQTRLSSMERNTDQFKQETEQILANIISTGSVRQKNNY